MQYVVKLQKTDNEVDQTAMPLGHFLTAIF